MIFFSTNSWASDAENYYKYLEKGQKAPFSGYLLEDKAMSKMISQYEKELAMKDVDIQYEKDRKEIELIELEQDLSRQISIEKTRSVQYRSQRNILMGVLGVAIIASTITIAL